VLDYAVELTYDAQTDAIAGAVTLTIHLTEDRDEFTLDSSGPVVQQVTVDGVAADAVDDDPELRITPAEPLRKGDEVSVRVEYTATPDALTSGASLPAGWFNTTLGSYVLNEPDGARTWLPSNDHPSDKATWTFTITVASGTTAVANGALVSSTEGTGGTTWVWREDDPMPTYLVLLLTGPYELVEGIGPGGLPLLSAVLSADRAVVQPYLDSIDEQIDFFDDLFGPYPLDRYGIAVSDSFGGLAMETLGRSLFSRDDLNGQTGFLPELLLSHELAHQWFGDAVSPVQWSDIWLNESFATYGQWLWLEHIGLTSLEVEAQRALDGRQAAMGSPTGSPTADELFSFNSYEGGATVLHALRRTIGDLAFYEVLQRWAAENNGTSRSTDDFIALAEEVAGTDLTALFDTWLYAERLPPQYPPPAG
jgi:aminopeptidase N